MQIELRIGRTYTGEESGSYVVYDGEMTLYDVFKEIYNDLEEKGYTHWFGKVTLMLWTIRNYNIDLRSYKIFIDMDYNNAMTLNDITKAALDKINQRHLLKGL